MRRLAILLTALCCAAGLLTAQAAWACDCGMQGDPATAGECPHSKDGKAKCTDEGKGCGCGKDCKCGKDAKDCKCAKADPAKPADKKAEPKAEPKK